MTSEKKERKQKPTATNKKRGKGQIEDSLLILLLSARDEIIIYLIGWDKLCEVL